jgi:hypothetical protein
MKLTTREKVLITILLAVIASWLFGCGKGPEHSTRHNPCFLEHFVTIPAPTNADRLPDAAYFQSAYAVYNDAYFQNKLPKVITIDLLEPNNEFMASTMCDVAGTVCTIHFNMKYVSADRVAKLTLKHEMCHVKTWMKDMDSLGVQNDHGRVWRACMLQLDMQGAFRQDIIDGYAEESVARSSEGFEKK